MQIIDFKSLDTITALKLARDLALRENNDPNFKWPGGQEKLVDVFFRICQEITHQPLKLDKATYGLIEKLDAQLFGHPRYFNTSAFILRGDPVKITKMITEASATRSCEHAWVNWFARALQENQNKIKRGVDIYGKSKDLEHSINRLLTTLAPGMKKMPLLWEQCFTPPCLAQWNAHHDAQSLDAATPKVSTVKTPRRM